MEEEELETTNSNEDDEELEEEFTDNEEVNEEEESSQELPTKEEVEQPKTFTQEEVDEMIKKRIKRINRENKETLSKYQELAYLTQEGLQTSSLDETLDKSREFYGKQGIKYVPENTDDEILGKAYAQEIIDECDNVEDIEKIAKRLESKVNLTRKEQAVLNYLNEDVFTKKKIAELKTIGVNESEYNSNEFKEFEKQFAKDTPIKDIYNLFRLKNTTTNVVDNPGSLKTVPTKEKKGYISEAEFDRMTDKQIEENMELIKQSMSKW